MSTNKYGPRVGGLLEIRKTRGLTQMDVAIRSGRSIPYVQQIEKGLLPKNPNAQGVIDIADALGVTVEQIRGEAS